MSGKKQNTSSGGSVVADGGRGFPLPTTPGSTIGREGSTGRPGSGSGSAPGASTSFSAAVSGDIPTRGPTSPIPAPSPPPAAAMAAASTLRRSSTPLHIPRSSSSPRPLASSRTRLRRDSLLTEITSASMDDILERAPQSSSWHSIALAFAVLPAVAGVLVEDAGQLVTDFLLLTLAAWVLRWFAKVPWEWYLASQPPPPPVSSSAVIDDDLDPKSTTTDRGSSSMLTEADIELARHNHLALMLCFLGPLIGGVLLHTIRTHLSRPSEGLVSNFNLTVFVIAAELRPIAQTIKLIRGKSVYLQSHVQLQQQQQQLLQHQQSHGGSAAGFHLSTTANSQHMAEIAALTERIHALEDIVTQYRLPQTPSHGRYLATSSVALTRDHDSEIEALTRAVRKYEKKEVRNDERIKDVEARLADVLSLAAAAAVVRVEEVERKKRGLVGRCISWGWGLAMGMLSWGWDVGVVGPVKMLDWALGVAERVKDGDAEMSGVDRGIGSGIREVRRREREVEKEKERRAFGVKNGHVRARVKMPSLTSTRGFA